MLKLAGADDHRPDDGPWQGAFFPGAVVGGRFELLREIGRGGFGTVFEARDRQLGRRVAFKAVRPGRRSQVQLRRDWLQREAEAVAQLSHHAIVSLHDVGASEAGPYLIFELLRGEDLHARLRRGRLPVGEALELAVAVGSALAHAHAAGVVHRDVKPSNVFLCEGGPVKVLDFGLSQVLGGTDTRGLGTPAYMAPEQWREAVQDARTDVFGAAVVLYETLTGRLPYRVDGEASAVLAPGARPAESSLVPRELRALLAAALSPDPAARPRDGQAWLEGLREVQSRIGGGRGAPGRGLAATGARPWVVAAGAALVLGALARWFLGR
jgi:serine/threonine protein kinase